MGCAAYAALFTCLGALKYFAHRNLVDFGIFAQTVTSAFGCFCNPLEGSHWAFHFSPILYLVAVVVWFVHSPLTMIALASLAAALSAPPLYAMVRARTDVQTARLSALVVWFYPPLAGLAFGDFHENVFAPAAVLWTLYSFDRERLVAAAAFAALTLAIKEDQAIFLAFSGLAGAVAYRHDRRRFRFAIAILLASLAVAALFFLGIQPHAAANPVWQPERFYAWSRLDWRALLAGGILERLGFLMLILAPLAFVPLRARASILAVPPLLEVLVSRMNTTFTVGTHYAGAWIGYLLVGFAAGIVDLGARGRAKIALYFALAFCVLEFLVADPLHPGLNLRARQPHDAALDAFLSSLPRNVSIATQEEAYTHLALNDPFARLLPETQAVQTQACFVLIDRRYPESARLREYGDTLERLVREGRYALVARSEGIELYRRNGRCR
ncbi:MAG: DUF2079 domain-containing protein [Candidatus Eremiobacteraeota bacterium]|nr:DUF2079 domain-containing protein [Candidatus Eremiobacteraeota bacterium]